MTDIFWIAKSMFILSAGVVSLSVIGTMIALYLNRMIEVVMMEKGRSS